jgi:hypothetical protein
MPHPEPPEQLAALEGSDVTVDTVGPRHSEADADWLEV